MEKKECKKVLPQQLTIANCFSEYFIEAFREKNFKAH